LNNYTDSLRHLLTDLRIALSLCTRLPLGPPAPIGDGDLARASWAFPLAGLVVGVAGAAVYWLASRVNLPAPPASALAIAATTLLTGAMHEDGLADTADGFGGGKTREAKLDIMRDSRIGAYGACALIISFMLRWSALAEIADPPFVTIALITAHVAARASLPAFMAFVPPARSDGLSSGVGQPPPQSAAIALLLGAIGLFLGFGAGSAMFALSMLAAIALLLAAFTQRQIGGQTGDVLGALQQAGEAAILLIATSLF
jgi:adenosylcobinamide-GDP ribazoletransferase